MKRCPQCRRDYQDDTLVYCLDDGSRLLHGPSHEIANLSDRPTEMFDPPTQILDPPTVVGSASPARAFPMKWVVLGSILVIALAAGISAYVFLWPPGAVSPIRSVAVLPLDNLSNDASQEFFADGMTEALIGNLSQVGSIKVISRTSVMRYKKSGKSIPEIATELGVDGIIEGSVQRSSEKVRVTAQLIHAATDSPIWSRSFEQSMTDVLKLQSEIAQAVVSEIKAQLTPEERQRLGRSSPVDPEASEAFLLGRHYFHKWTKESERQAVEHLQKAVTIQPDYAEAWAALADAWQVRSMVGDIGVKDAEAPARAAAIRALELDPNSSAAHVSMCFIHNNYDFNWVDGEAACKKGIEFDPNNAKAHFAYAYLLARMERWDEMSVEMEKAIRLDPAEPWWPGVFGAFLIQAGRLDEAQKNLQRSNAVDPNWTPGIIDRTDLYVEQGRYDDAIEISSSTGVPDPLTLSYIYARKGDRAKALQLLNSAPKNDLYALAKVYTALDDFDNAFEVINQSLDRGEGFMFGYGSFRVLDKLHSDPRWKDVRRRMNLA